VIPASDEGLQFVPSNFKTCPLVGVVAETLAPRIFATVADAVVPEMSPERFIGADERLVTCAVEMAIATLEAKVTSPFPLTVTRATSDALPKEPVVALTVASVAG
jgi:hypothetical protein